MNNINNQKIKYNLQKLQTLVINNNLSHAILLIGDLEDAYITAKAFAKNLLCDVGLKNIICSCAACKIFEANSHPDYFLIDLGFDQEIKIDLIRQVNNFVNTYGYLGNKKIVLINNFYNINHQAANAFLKTLEEPCLSVSPNTGSTEILFLLIVNNKHSVPATILSRVLQFNIFEPIRNNNQNYKQSEILQDLYNMWVQDPDNLFNIVKKWQLYPKQELINCLWFIMTNIIKASTDQGLLFEIKNKVSAKLPWQLLDSLNYLNKLIILGYQVNWQLFLYNFIMTKFTGENIYAARTGS